MKTKLKKYKSSKASRNLNRPIDLKLIDCCETHHFNLIIFISLFLYLFIYMYVYLFASVFVYMLIYMFYCINSILPPFISKDLNNEINKS